MKLNIFFLFFAQITLQYIVTTNNILFQQDTHLHNEIKRNTTQIKIKLRKFNQDQCLNDIVEVNHFFLIFMNIIL